jgi:hypothetical protein
LYFFPDRIHFAGKLQSGNILWHAWRRRIVSKPLQHIRAIEPCGSHAKPDLICCRWPGFLDFSNLEHLRAAKFGYDNCFHE